MLSLADGVIVARVFCPPFTHVLDLLLCVCGCIQRVWLIHNRAVLLGPSCCNMSMSVKTVGHLSNKMFHDGEFLMTMHVCEEQLSHFLVFSIISFQKVHNF